METKKVSTITSNEDFVRMKIFDGELGVDDSSKELIRLAHSQMKHMRERVNEIVDNWDKAIMDAKADEREACAVTAIAETMTPGQRNAKDRWVEQIGLRVAAAIRKRGEV